MPPPRAVESHAPCYPLQGYAVSSKRETPLAKPVASKEVSSDLFRSNHRETPPDKPVASKSFHTTSLSLGVNENPIAYIGFETDSWVERLMNLDSSTLIAGAPLVADSSDAARKIDHLLWW